MMTRIAAATALSLSALLASGVAQAVPTYCSAGSPHADGLSVNDVTFRGSSANDCFGVQMGNDVGAQGAFIGWNGYELLVTDDAGGGSSTNSWMGVNWTLSGTTSQRNGTYTLRWSDPVPVSLPLTLDLIVITKASNRFASYLFDRELFQSSPSSSTGTWHISYKNNGGQIPNLSHLSIWARLSPTTRVPEPGSLGLVALGLAAMGVALMRRPARQA